MRYLISALILIATGCATPQPTADIPALRAEQTLVIALATVDTALKFEADNRALVPESIRTAAAEVRDHAAKAFTTADDVRLAYKRGQATESKLLLCLTLVEELVVQVKWWGGQSPNNPAGQSATGMILLEAEVYASGSPAGWVTTVPIVVHLAKEVYQLVNEVRSTFAQDTQWTSEQDAEFRSKLLRTVTSDHWK